MSSKHKIYLQDGLFKTVSMGKANYSKATLKNTMTSGILKLPQRLAKITKVPTSSSSP